MLPSKKWTNTGKGQRKKNMDSILLIEKHLSDAQTPDDLALAVVKALEQRKPSAQWILLKYHPGSHPFTVLFSNSKRMPKANELVATAFKNWGSFYLDDVASSGIAYLLVCSSSFDEQSNAILKTWRILHRMIQSFTLSVQTELNMNIGNQFSQLLHDVESLIALFQNPSADQESVNKRIQYQQRLNKRLLAYIREPELLKTNVSIGDLLNAWMQKQNLDTKELPVQYVNLPPDTQIEVDFELFDQALSEILDNAKTATNDDFNKIKIEVRKQTDQFHLILKEWIIVSIIDQGIGINPDFLNWVAMPYFTTWKEKGHSGFGLPIAQKILEAHQGFLEIHSAQGSGTEVNLYLPGFQNDAE